MKLTFLGADREVTGSCTQLEAAGHRFLIDCGMEQGRDVYENADLPCAPGTYEALLLTHAHIDHSGRIPYLYKNGYRGPIYTTDATRDLCAIMLEDSAHIQEQEAEWKNRKAMRSGAEMIEPDYTVEDAVAEHWANHLKEEGYEADAPYNGSIWIAAEGRVACAEVGNTRKIIKTKSAETVRTSAAYDRLANMGRRLLEVIRHNQGGANKDLAKFASQIAALCDKWDR